MLRFQWGDCFSCIYYTLLAEDKVLMRNIERAFYRKKKQKKQKHCYTKTECCYLVRLRSQVCLRSIDCVHDIALLR